MLRHLFIMFFLVNIHAFSVCAAVPPQSNCVVLYYLDGPNYLAFQLQIKHMQNQLIRDRIQLVDLYKWRNEPPHIQLSGRQRQQVSQAYSIVYGVNQALVFAPFSSVPSELKGTVDIIDILFSCRQRNKID